MLFQLGCPFASFVWVSNNGSRLYLEGNGAAFDLLVFELGKTGPGLKYKIMRTDDLTANKGDGAFQGHGTIGYL